MIELDNSLVDCCFGVLDIDLENNQLVPNYDWIQFFVGLFVFFPRVGIGWLQDRLRCLGLSPYAVGNPDIDLTLRFQFQMFESDQVVDSDIRLDLDIDQSGSVYRVFHSKYTLGILGYL